MEKMRNSFFILLLIGVFISCKKENSIGFTTNNNLQINDTTWSKTNDNKVLVKAVTADLSVAPLVANVYFNSVGIDDDNSIFNNDNFRLSIEKNSLFNPVSKKPFLAGKLTINLLALNSNGGFIRNYSPSYINNQQNQGIGFYNLKIYCNDTLLTIKQGNDIHLFIKDSLTNYTSLHDINVYQSNDNDITDNQFNWYNDSSASHNIGYWNLQGYNYHFGYDVQLSQLGWVSLLAQTKGQSFVKPSINVDLPVNFTNKNTLVYLAQNDTKSVARLLPDLSSRTFRISNLPLSQNYTIVTVSKIDNQYYLGYSNSVYTSNQSIFHISPQQITIANLIDYLNLL